MKKIQVRMLTSMSGEINCAYGDEIELEPEVAERFAERGVAEICRSTPRDRSERAVKKTAKKKAAKKKGGKS